jgi:hypothetical protein
MDIKMDILEEITNRICASVLLANKESCRDFHDGALHGLSLAAEALSSVEADIAAQAIRRAADAFSYYDDDEGGNFVRDVAAGMKAAQRRFQEKFDGCVPDAAAYEAAGETWLVPPRLRAAVVTEDE